ncbi:uncharacterized protein CTRU02_204978 [Colletotrichum truncatum]|uniref:Uncharacterized protein n=1 Tax=Colletotrichum truncatum TaxID=5467 RepID=A0ACC3Z2N3_COLTU
MSSEAQGSTTIDKIRALPDLRAQPKNVAYKQVLEKWPGEKDNGQPAGSLHRKHRGLDVLLIVARYILITHPDGRSIETDSNPILELAWKDMESSEYKASVEAIKEEIIDLMTSDGRLPDASFASLCESPTMLETLWKHPTLLLCGPLEILRKETEEEEEKWMPHQMIGADFLSKLSLVTWDGELDLVEKTRQIWYHSQGKDEKDLLRLEFSNGQCYTLLVAVWLRSDNTAPVDNEDNLDFVHMYSLNMADVFPVVANKCTARSPDTIGQGGHSYMLFYVANNAASMQKNYARCLRNGSPPGTYTDAHIGKQTPEKEELWAQFFAADLTEQNSIQQTMRESGNGSIFQLPRLFPRQPPRQFSWR